jgi:hypothetical protein
MAAPVLAVGHLMRNRCRNSRSTIFSFLHAIILESESLGRNQRPPEGALVRTLYHDVCSRNLFWGLSNLAPKSHNQCRNQYPQHSNCPCPLESTLCLHKEFWMRRLWL